MQIYNNDFSVKHAALSKEPRYVAVIDFDGGDLHYFTSHSDCLLPSGLTAAEYTHSVLKVQGLSSQTLSPNDGRATIGSMAFNLQDNGGAITELLRTKLEAGKGLRKTTAELYRGYVGLTDFATQYELVGTQIVDGKLDYSKKESTYKVKCLDPQRLLKADIFEQVSTNITATVAIDATTINVIDTSAFELFEHDAGYDDAPNQTVGYLKLKQGSDAYEIVRYTGKTASTFTGVTRAVLGTKELVHEYTVGDEADTQIEVEEYIYLEGPILKIAYAILTGSLYGQAGKTLPSGWGLGVDTAYINTASFTAIGEDVWDTADPSLGYQCRFQGMEKEEGKAFFEKELMLLAGCFHTVGDDGQITIRRMANAAANASTLGTLNASCITAAPTLTHDMGAVANIYSIIWNWEDLLGEYTRATAMGDADSVATHELGDTKSYTFRGMYGNRMTTDRIYQRFDSLRAMYAGPPLLLTVTCHSRVDMYELGDTVRVQLDNVRDFTNGAQVTLDRAFMVHGKKLNAKNGAVTYTLFGSSQDASAVPPPSIRGLEAVLPDSFYSDGLNAANNIETMALAVDPVNGFEVVAGVGILKVDITCTGVAGNINHVGSIFWYDGDFEIASGVTVTYVNGAQFRFRGYAENKGVITGKGNGLAGAPASSVGAPGTVGGIGITRGGGGIISSDGFGSGWATATEAWLAEGPASLSPVTVEYDGSQVTVDGLKRELRGTSGGGGGGAWNNYLGTWINGGAGGDSGAPIAIISRGFSTLSGSIDTSGNDGLPGSYTSAPAYGGFYSGSGTPGAPGAFVGIIDGPANSFTGISKITADYGAFFQPGTPMDQPAAPSFAFDQPYSSFYPAIYSASMGTAAMAITYVTGQQAPQPDVPQQTSNDLAPTLVEQTNTPRSAAGNLSTIEIKANDSGDSNYAGYSNAYYRIKGTDQWTKVVVPASPETTQIVASDGTIYEVQTRSVSTVGKESPWGAIAEITVADVDTPTVEDANPTTLDGLSIPNVHGLELFEQGNDAEFTGKDAKFAWRKTAASDFYEIGHEPTGLGADAGTLDLYFQDYFVSVYSGTTLLREEAVTDNWYTYNYEKNAEDYRRVNGSDGAYREFRVEVVARVTFTAAVSETPAKLTVSNPAPELPTGISLKANFSILVLEYATPTDLDYKGCKIWLGTSSGFTRNDASLVYNGPGTKHIIEAKADGTKLSSGVTYYVVIQAVDEFGDEGTESVELSATTLKISGQYDIEYQSIQTAQLGLAIIENANVNDMAVDKLTSGDFTGKYINITSGGNIRSGQTAFHTGTGFWIGDVSGTPKLSIGNPSGSYMKWDGSGLELSGQLVAATGTFAGSLSAATGTFAGSLSAATGTFSGVLTASAINAVDTINIAGRAVTIPVSAYTAGIISCPASATTTVQSVSITSEGAEIAIESGLFVAATSNVNVELWRDSSLRYVISVIQGIFSFPKSETPGIGLHTYHIKISVPAGVTCSASYRSLLLTETMK